MASFTVHTSSSLNHLATALAVTLSARPAPPLARETVVVLSNGMGRWLSMELAAGSGVCAGMDFVFPNDTLDACFRAVIPGLPESSPFALDTMAWRIAGLLPSHLHRPGFESIAAYLGDPDDDRRLLQRIAGYSYETHFGGAIYVFLRGLTRGNPQQGIYRDRPSAAFIERAEKLLLR